jgi:HlyD family secretion protein
VTVAKSKSSSELDAFLDRPKPSFLSRYGRWIAIGAVLLVVLLIVSRCVAGKPTVEYQTASVERGDLAISVTAVGNLAPTNQVIVGSQTSGLVSKVLADVNDQVQAGQPIATIDTRRLDDSIRGAEAQLAAQLAVVEQQRATVRETQAQLARFKEVSRLSQGRVPSQSEMATAEASVARSTAALRSAEAQVTVAQTTVSSNKIQREYAVIRSPVAGVILSRQVEPGQTVAAQFNTPTLFTIAEDLGQMKLDVSIDEADVGQVKAGQVATFTVDAFPGREFPAVIKRVNLGSAASGPTNQASGSVVSYTATLIVANRDLTLRPGMTATATIGVSSARGVMLVPNAALRYQPEAEAGPGAKPKGPGAIKFGPPGTSRTQVAKKERRIGIGSHQTVYVLGAKDEPEPVAVVTGMSDGKLTEVSSSQLRVGMKAVLGRKATPK